MTKKVYFTFARMATPNASHKKLVDHIVDSAKKDGAEHRVYLSKSEGDAKNPISYKDKVDIVRKSFPHANVVDDKDATTAFGALRSMSKQGVRHARMIVGPDRVKEFHQRITPYIKKRSDPDFDEKKHIDMDSFEVKSRPIKKGEGEGVHGSQLRDMVRKGDYGSFSKNAANPRNPFITRRTYKTIKRNLKEELGRLPSLQEYMTEQVARKGTLNVFDIDDTLFLSSAKARVVKDGKILHRLNTAGRAAYQLKPGEDYDFSEYSSGQHFYDTATPIEKMIRRAELTVKYQGPTSKTIICTARSDMDNHKIFRQKFREHGFPIDKVFIERAGNLSVARRSPELAKAIVINRYLKTGNFDVVRMWDDHEDNLRMVAKLKLLHPDIRFEMYKVDPETGIPTKVT